MHRGLDVDKRPCFVLKLHNFLHFEEHLLKSVTARFGDKVIPDVWELVADTTSRRLVTLWELQRKWMPMFLRRES